MTTEQSIVFGALLGPSIIGLGWLFFRTWEEFFDCLLHSLTPDFISRLKGNFLLDILGEFKFFLFLVASLLVAAGEKWAIEEIWEYFI